MQFASRPSCLLLFGVQRSSNDHDDISVDDYPTASGRGVPQGYVQAHMWFTLSVLRSTDELGRLDSVGRRDKAAGLMNPTQIAEAQRLAREWDAAHPQ